jgi:ubiquinone/menaquinone biosynthesis C-methylase UbiE
VFYDVLLKGIVTEELYKKFNKVIGTDPSEKMLAAIETRPSKDEKPAIDYKVASAEDLSFIPSNSVDMVTSGQAAHWFKQDKAFPEIARILKRGGTLAFWGILVSLSAYGRLWQSIHCRTPGTRLNY